MRLLTSIIVIAILMAPMTLMARDSQPEQPSSQSQEIRAFQVERVIDGDTLVATGMTIRLWGIDAPEEDEPAAFASKLFLESIISSGAVACERMYKDPYGRTVARCFSDGLDVAAMLVLFGMASDYKKYSNGYYAIEEQVAKEKKRGIWQ